MISKNIIKLLQNNSTEELKLNYIENINDIFKYLYFI